MSSSSDTLDTQGSIDESARRRFESAWKAGTPPRLEDFLPPADSPLFLGTLEELVHIDLEFAWRLGGDEGPSEEVAISSASEDSSSRRRPLVEWYLRRFPQLNDSSILRRLLQQEHVMRQKQGDQPTLGDYCARFPDLDLTLREVESWLRRTQPERALIHIPGYQVLELLGRGGMGVVYKARDLSLRRLVALKMIRAGQHDSEGLARFKAEAHAVARLKHPNVVQIYEVGEHEGQPYCSLEYVEGGSLAVRLQGAPQRPRESASLVEKLAHAVQAAHEQGIVHRDLKPANVLLGFSLLMPKITDFGLAKFIEVGDASAAATQSGAVLGTPSYMAPEQASGSNRTVGPAADVYALGAILYEMLTGRPPFQADTPMNTVFQVMYSEAVAPRRLQPTVPRDLETICLKCLRKDASKRYASAKALADDLRRYLEGKPIQARPVGVVGRLTKWARRNPVVASLVGLVIVVAAVGFGLVTWSLGEAIQERNQKEEARAALAVTADQEAKAKNQALAALDLAEVRRQETQLGLNAARRNLYFHLIASAERAWLAGEQESARAFLDECPPDQRHWEWGYLQWLFEGSLLTLQGHPDMVRKIVFSADGKRLASAGGDTILVWNAADGKQLVALKNPDAPVTEVAFSGDGKQLASGDFAGKVRTWDLGSGKETLVGALPEKVQGLFFTGNALTAASRELLRTWDLNAGRRPHDQTFASHDDIVAALAFSRDGKHIASAAYDRTVKIWKTADGKEAQTLRGHRDRVFAVAFSADGKRVASGGADFQVKVWDAATGDEHRSLQGHTGPVWGVAFSPDGQRLASAAWDQTVRIWDLHTGQVLIFQGHSDKPYAVAFGGETRLATGGFDKIVKVWDASTGQQERPLTFTGHKDGVSAAAISPGGKLVASGAGMNFIDHDIRLWDPSTAKERLRLQGHAALICSLDFCKKTGRLASCDFDDTVKIWDVERRKEVVAVQKPGCRVNRAAFSANGELLVGACFDHHVRIWNAETGLLLHVLKGHAGPVEGVAFAPGGTVVASAGQDKCVILWDAVEGKKLSEWTGAAHPIHGIAFGGDGRRLATAGGAVLDNGAREEGEIIVWDAVRGVKKWESPRQSQTVHQVAFTADGLRLASAAGRQMDPEAPGEVKVWEAQEGREILSLKGHRGPVRCVVFSPDDRRLISASWDKTLKVWEAKR